MLVATLIDRYSDWPMGQEIIIDDLVQRVEAICGANTLDVATLFDQFHSESGLSQPDAFFGWLFSHRILTRPQYLLLQQQEGIAPTGEFIRQAAAEERFNLLGVLGAGAMGEVHLARDPGLGRTVALKVMKPDQAHKKGLFQRFLFEARVSAQLDHPNIVPVYTMERSNQESPAFSMKLVQGNTFDEYLEQCHAQEQRGEVDAEHRLEARLENFLKVCDAMAHAHARQVIHRDLKPENLMVGAFGEVYVMDWGIAKLIRQEDLDLEELASIHPDDAGPGATRAGVAVGTPCFMSPEQALGNNNELTAAADQFSLGLILFELATLQRANVGTTSVEAMLNAQEAQKRPFEHAFGQPLSKELEAVIDKATALEPADRYESVREFAFDIRRYLRDEETEALPDDRYRQASRWVEHNAAKAAIAAMAGILVTVLFASGVSVASLANVIKTQSQAAASENRKTSLVRLVDHNARAIDLTLFRHESL
ncbi:MAG: serine/threonine protein kinase, partial [Proteobacteria bacterium]|nr:serine/threonine protein kinase [Pseudomonadota bacterium]